MEEKIYHHAKFGYCRYKKECKKVHFNKECKDNEECKKLNLSKMAPQKVKKL